MDFSENIKRDVWNKGNIVEKYPKEKVRKDDCGAWILWDDFGKRDSPFGWEIDHIFPEALLKVHNVADNLSNSIDNLRPLHWKNNQAKGTSYPIYKAAVKGVGDHNEDYIQTFEINAKTQEIIKALFHL